MFNRLNIRLLLVIFMSLLILVMVVHLFDAQRGERTFRSNLFDLDTADVTRLVINPKGVDKPNVVFTRQDQIWSVGDGETKYAADQQAVRDLLSTLSSLEAERVASKDKDNWKRYEVTDSLATIVTAQTNKDEQEIYIGSFSYTQPRQVQPNPYAQQGKMTTFVRRGDDAEVYAVEGFLGMTFNRDLNNFRVKTVIKSNQFDWRSLHFNYPDSSFNLMAEETQWMVDGINADSAAVAGYLKQIASLTSTDFVSSHVVQGESVFSLEIKGQNMNEPIIIDAYRKNNNDGFILHSSQNPDAYFDGKNLTNKIFIGKKALLPSEG